MRANVLPIMIHAALAGCATVIDLPPEVTPEHHVGGHVRGLWGLQEGATGLALQLETTKGALACTASGNGIMKDGDFQCEDLLPVGTSYDMKIEDNPWLHTCVVDAGRSGVIGDADTKDVSIGCAGPGNILISVSGWTFDPTLDDQPFEGPIGISSVAFTFVGPSLAYAIVPTGNRPMIPKPDGETVSVSLSSGSNTVTINLATIDGLSKTYVLRFKIGSQRQKFDYCQHVYSENACMDGGRHCQTPAAACDAPSLE